MRPSTEADNGMNRENDIQRKSQRQALILGLVVVAMFGFGFAMVPLYKLVCSVAGINNIADSGGRVRSDVYLPGKVDRSRTITVEFDATLNTGLPWELLPAVKKVKVHPGEINVVSWHVKNNSDRKIVAQAVPGVTPWQATEYLEKIECFCFTQQTLAPGESREMPLRFVIDAKLPESIKTLTLSYTFMDTDRSALKAAGQS